MTESLGLNESESEMKFYKPNDGIYKVEMKLDEEDAMGRTIESQYMPDSVSPPGETLQETLEAFGMSHADLAERTGYSEKMINEIIKGKASITSKISLELEMVLGVPASFWNNRERQYRENRCRKSLC